MNIINLVDFSDEMDNDDSVINMILLELKNAIEEQIPRMKSLIDNNKFETLGREAHSIKGGARNIMAEGLEKASSELEIAADSSDKVTISLAFSSLLNEFQRFKDYIKTNLNLG